MSAIAESLQPVLSKLEKRVNLSDEDRRAFLNLPFTRKDLGAGACLTREGDPARTCSAVLSGFAYRHKTIANGARQIISVQVVGDLLDVENALFGTATHSVQMMTSGSLAVIPAAVLEKVMAERPALQRAVWLSTLVDSSVFGEWIANVGRRDARARISHLLCELAVRLKAVGLLRSGTYDLPMTQEQIGDATGLTAVHVNRTIQDLRRSGVISNDKRSVTVQNWRALTDIGGFDPAYLHEGTVAALS